MRRNGLSAAALKNTAMITMLADHFAVFLYLPLLQDAGVPDPYDDPLYGVLRGVGRIAFPIYCFLISEGFCHTGDVRLYLLRLLGAGILSEVPFSLAMSGRVFDPEDTNVYFSLFLGLLAVCLADALEKRPGDGAVNRIASVLCFAACCLAAVLIKCDYLMLGPMLIMSFHLTRERKDLLVPVFAVTLITGSAVMYMLYCRELSSSPAVYMKTVLEGVCAELPALLALPFIAVYNGEKGRQLPKYFYYLFYPAHLLLLWMLRTAVTGR